MNLCNTNLSTLSYSVDYTFSAPAETLWDNHKDSITDDVLHQHRIRRDDPAKTFRDDMYNELLIAFEDLFISIA